MYEAFYGLRERPFDLTPDPRFLFRSAKHREALATLQYGLTSQKGVTLVTGDAGTGKTTLIRTALQEMRMRDCKIACLDNPILTRAEFLEFIVYVFDLPPEVTSSKTRVILELQRSALERHQAAGTTALIVDEAQAMSDELLEEIRLLANIETDTHKLLSIILTGQPELAARLNQQNLRQLKQRVAIRCALEPLSGEETAAYIAARLWVAGGSSTDLFTDEAVRAIHDHSRGIPRTISVICDNALIAGFAGDERPVDVATVLEVCEGLDLEPLREQRLEFTRTPAGGWPAPPAAAATAGASTEHGAPDREAGNGNGSTSEAAVIPSASRGKLFSSLFAEPRRSGLLQLFQLF